ncbi:LemA family protein [Verrucomicrobiota bacterium]
MNKKLTIFVMIILLLVVVPLLIWWSSYNKIVSFDEQIESSWAQVETVLQRRYELVPDLVNTVKDYASNEKELFEEVTRLRSKWAGAKTSDAKVKAANALESVLGRLMVVAENYPGLKANQKFMALQNELAGTESRISVERGHYNAAIEQYNRIVRRFPSNLIAAKHGFGKKDVYFEASE